MWGFFVTFIYLIPAAAVTIQTLSPPRSWRGPDQHRNSSDCFHDVSLNSLERGFLGLNELINRQETDGLFWTTRMKIALPATSVRNGDGGDAGTTMLERGPPLINPSRY